MHKHHSVTGTDTVKQTACNSPLKGRAFELVRTRRRRFILFAMTKQISFTLDDDVFVVTYRLYVMQLDDVIVQIGAATIHEDIVEHVI